MLRALAAAAVLAVIVAGPPWALVRYVGWPLPDRVPTAADWRQWLEQPLTRTTMIAAVACLFWLLWAWLIIGLVQATIAHLRRAPARRRARLPVPLHSMASGLIGAVVLTVTDTTTPPTATITPPVPAPVGPPASAPAPPNAPSDAPAFDALASDAVPSGPERAAGAGPRGGTGDEHPSANAPVDAQPAETGAAGTGAVEVRGGWLPPDAAAVVSAIGAAAWLERRNRYQPRPPTGADRADPDLSPLPATVTSIREALHTAAGTAPSIEDEAASAGLQPSIGTTVSGGPLYSEDLPNVGVGLAGPGATDAIRAILILSALDPRPDAPTVHTTHADLDGLLPAGGFNNGRLRVHSTVDALLAAVGNRTAGDGRPVLIVVESPDTASADRLQTLLGQPDRPSAVAVLHGTWPPGHTWHVRGDGTIRTTPPTPAAAAAPAVAVVARLAVLDAAAATDILTTQNPTTTAEPTAPGPGGDTARTRRPTAPAPAPVSHPVLALRILGPPLLCRTTDPTNNPGDHADPVELVRVRRSAGLQILLYLAIHRGGASSDDLKAVIWPDISRSAAAVRFDTTISELRRDLRAAAGHPVIRQTRTPECTFHWLDPQHIDVDLWHLHQAVNSATIAADPAACVRALREVIDVYRGPLADGLPYQWLMPHREAVLRHLLDAYATLTQAEPDPVQAAVWRDAALRHAPTNTALRHAAPTPR